MAKKTAEKSIHIDEKCGRCVWFYEPQGEADLTCAERSGVEKNTKACKDFYAKPFNLSILKSEDPFFVKTREILSDSKFNIDLSILNELEKYFVICDGFKEGGSRLRHVPVCSYGSKEAAQLLSLFEKTQALRDRTLSIKLGLLSLMSELRHIEAIGKQYIFENYNSSIQAMKTESIRQISIDILLSPLSEKIMEISDIIDMANLVYENLKDTYFSLKEIKDIACAFLMSTRLKE